jgi:hypothetical protein
MGALKAQVRLMPVNPGQDAKIMKTIENLVRKREGETYTADYLQTENDLR